MTESELNKTAKMIAKKLWNLELDIPVKISPRYKTSFGRFYYVKNTRKAKEIKIAKFLINNYSKSSVVAILAHELAHWALFKLNKPFKDKDKYFKSEIKRLGIPTGDCLQLAGNFADLTCPNCKTDYQRIYVFSSADSFIKKFKCTCGSNLVCTKSWHIEDQNKFKVGELLYNE